MQKDNRFFEDIARMASGAGSALMEMRHEMEAMVHAQMEKVLHRMDLVTREDFNLVREMAIKARTEQEQLARRVEELEKLLGEKTPPAEKPAKKPAAKKA